MARASNREELDELSGEMEDRFGPLPARVLALLAVMDLRRHLKRALVTRLRRQGVQLVLRFHETSDIDPARLVAIAKKRKDFRLLPDNEVAFPVPHIDLGGITEAILGLLHDLGVDTSGGLDTPEENGQSSEPSLEVGR
jgi:transcription-repair coupling factor (superfamily II helicase)